MSKLPVISGEKAVKSFEKFVYGGVSKAKRKPYSYETRRQEQETVNYPKTPSSW